MILNPTSAQYHVSVIGAGIVGLCTALKLLDDGHRVTLFDPRVAGTATSFGNAGSISTTALMPYSTPGLWKRLPWMLGSDRSPLRLPVSNWHRSLPWAVRFLAAGFTREQVEQHAAAMAPMMRRTVDAHRHLMGRHDIDPLLIRPAGWLSVYRRRKDVDLDGLEFELLRRHDMDVDVLGPEELNQLEPGLSREFQLGIFNKHDWFTVQPYSLSKAYYEAFLGAGGEICGEQVRRFEIGPQGPTRIVTDLGFHAVDRLVLCAGAWSRSLAKQLGSPAPVEAERGYHLNIPWSEGLSLNRPVFVADGYYVMCPMRDGVRVTSGSEFGGVELPPDFRRIYRMLDEARRSLPGLGDTPDREWMGWRPSLPDSRPVIGRSPLFGNVFFGFGHGHLGLTLSAITAEIVSNLVSQRSLPFDIAAFRPDRF
ncbi:MAG: FAD-dependent oxidoreductase [Thiotrichales bacterium]|nr:FAD-dependent oxidoreductase [Thiotrichales bacterium]